jgi:hypothetical protein
MLRGCDLAQGEGIGISKGLAQVSRMHDRAATWTCQHSFPDSAYPPCTQVLGERGSQCNGIPNSVLGFKQVEARLAGARQGSSRRLSPLDDADRRQDIVLGASQLLAILVGAGVDGVAAFVVELDVAVGGSGVVARRNLGLRRRELDVRGGLRGRGRLGGLKGRPSLARGLDRARGHGSGRGRYECHLVQIGLTAHGGGGSRAGTMQEYRSVVLGRG